MLRRRSENFSHAAGWRKVDDGRRVDAGRRDVKNFHGRTRTRWWKVFIGRGDNGQGWKALEGSGRFWKFEGSVSGRRGGVAGTAVAGKMVSMEWKNLRFSF